MARMSRIIPQVIMMVCILTSLDGLSIWAAGEVGTKASRSTARHRATVQKGGGEAGKANSQVQRDTHVGGGSRHRKDEVRNIQRVPGASQPTLGSKNKKVQRHKKQIQREHRNGAPQSAKERAFQGMLQSPSRYDPSLGARFSGAADPHVRELTHDHFQELDRNRDGTIDPFERTMGRLDMDRDRATHSWE